MKKILIATNNKGKLEELKNLLKEYEILSMKDVNCNIEVVEDGKTFEENAKKKAKEIYDITKIPCIADDSGLCIDYFDGWPGIYTARFLGPNSTKEEINNYILEKMKNLKDEINDTNSAINNFKLEEYNKKIEEIQKNTEETTKKFKETGEKLESIGSGISKYHLQE